MRIQFFSEHRPLQRGGVWRWQLRSSDTQIHSSAEAAARFCQRYEKVYLSRLYSECFERYKATPLSTTLPQHFNTGQSSLQQNSGLDARLIILARIDVNTVCVRTGFVRCYGALCVGDFWHNAERIVSCFFTLRQPIAQQEPALACHGIVFSANTAGSFSSSF